MTNDIELSSQREEVLRKIGRNVVNFQKMEGMLKFLNAQQALNGELKDIPQIAARAKKSTSNLPMGRLADAFLKSAYSSAAGVTEPSEGENVTVSFSFRIEADPALTKERKKALRSVVIERNNLIHKWLASFDPNSLESCRALETALDAQHARIWPEFQTLKGILGALKYHHAELSRYLASDDFMTDITESTAGA